MNICCEEESKEYGNDYLKAVCLELMKFIKDVADNYNCDQDAHKYGTRCRECEAQKLVNKFKRIAMDAK